MLAVVRVLQATRSGGSIVRGHGNLPVLSHGRHLGRASEVATRRQRCESTDAFRSMVCASPLAGDQVRGHHRRWRTSPP